MEPRGLPAATNPMAIDKVRPDRRSAGFQPAVSPISNRQNVAIAVAPGLSRGPRAGSTAIQQVGNLRYDFVNGPATNPPLPPCGIDGSTAIFGSAISARLLSLAPQGWLGLALLAICWPLNWTLPGMRTAYLFFPLWLGYVLVVDALVERRTGSSLWMRSRRDFVLLFVASSPVWWIFEVLNKSTENW